MDISVRLHAPGIRSTLRQWAPVLMHMGVMPVALIIFFSFVIALAPGTLARTVDASDGAHIFHRLGVLENNGHDTFRWSGAEWWIALHGFARREPVVLSVRMSSARPSHAPQATVRLDGASRGAPFTVGQHWRVYHVLARPRVDAQGLQAVQVTSSTFAPGHADDARLLGVAVHSLVARQLPSSIVGSFVTARGLFLAGLSLLIALLFYRAGLRLSIVAGVTALATMLLGILQWFVAAWLVYWLPNTWFLLSAAILVVVLPPLYNWLRERSMSAKHSFIMVVGGLGLSAGGTLLIWMSQQVSIGLLLAIGGAAITLLSLRDRKIDLTLLPSPINRGELMCLLVITAVALVLRLYRLNDLPLALWRDEARHGLEALDIWRFPGYRPVYVLSGVDLPALLFYLMAPVVGTFGPDIWTLRLVPALGGSFTPLALWFALRPMVGRRTALLAAACMAALAWSLSMSRWAFPAIFDPLFVLFAIGCVWRGLTASVSRWWAIVWLTLAGISTGLAVYTYHTGRLAPLLVAVIGAMRLGGDARRWRPALLPLSIALLGFSLTMAPLLQYALQRPQAFNERVGMVRLFQDDFPEPTTPLGLLQDNVLSYASMWHVQGDHNPRHYAPLRPMLDPFSGVLFLIGLGFCLFQRPSIGIYLPLWLGLGLLPGLFSTDAPHAMRVIGAMAPTCALVAIGMDSVLKTIFQTPLLSRAAVGVLLMAITLWNVQVYTNAAGDWRSIFDEYDTPETLIGRAAYQFASSFNQQPAGCQVYIWHKTLEQDVTRFLTSGVAVGWFDGVKLAPAPHDRAILFLPGDVAERFEAEALRAMGSGAQRLGSGPPDPIDGKPIYIIYGRGPGVRELVDLLLSADIFDQMPHRRGFNPSKSFSPS